MSHTTDQIALAMQKRERRLERWFMTKPKAERDHIHALQDNFEVIFAAGESVTTPEPWNPE